LLAAFFQTPSPFGYSLLSKKESFVIPPLEEEVDSTASAVEDGGVLFSSHVFLLHDRF